MTARMVEYLCARGFTSYRRGLQKKNGERVMVGQSKRGPWHVATGEMADGGVQTRCGQLLKQCDLQTRFTVDGMCETCMRLVLR